MSRGKIPPKNQPLVSVVVTTKNEEKNIGNCLESVLQQTYPEDKIEIIVVDNHSTDKTKQIAQKYTDKVFNKGPERSSQRNFGAQKAKGRYYLYLDADMTLSPKVIEESVDKLEKDKHLLALYIPEIVTGQGFWSRVRRFERSFYNATVIDAVRFIRIKDFLATGGFDESISGPEDIDLDKRIRKRGKVGIIKAPLYHHEADFKFLPYLRKKKYYTQGFDTYAQKWGRDDPDVKKQLGFYYRFIGVFAENGKWKKLIRQPILALGMYFLRFLVALTYLVYRGKIKR